MLHIGQLKKQQGEVWIDRKDGKGKVKVNRRYLPQKNNHPTVKPIQLFSYLVTLGSRKDDVVLDPFMGSGTTPISCVTLDRKYLGIEREKDYFEIAEARVEKAKNPANLVEHEFF
jgi:DNA modification methylase